MHAGQRATCRHRGAVTHGGPTSGGAGAASEAAWRAAHALRKEAAEIPRILEAEIVGNLRDGHPRVAELAFRFDEHPSDRRQLELPVVLPHENRLPGCLSQNVTALILILAPSLPANKARSAA